ncbi:MAG TPA: PKD domain-containing protein, partial [Thermoplasmata archaeon]|nr:PKD domain-containing protein [Thermoplasmata archaeon]
MRAVTATVLMLALLTAGNAMAFGPGAEPARDQDPPVPLATTSLRGWVKDSTNSTGIPNVFVHTESGPQGQQVNDTGTNASGYYSADVESGRVSAFYLESAYYTQIWNFTASGAVYWLNVSLDPAPPRSGTIQGRVTDLITGLPLADPLVIAIKSDWTYINLTTGDGSGAYKLNVIPGSYAMDAQVPGYSGTGQAKSTPVADGQKVWHNISLLPNDGQNVTLKGYVRDSLSSNPINGATVKTVDIFKQDNQTRTDNVGYYQIQIYQANTSLLFTASQYAPHKDRIKPALGQTVYWYNVSLDPDTTPPKTDLTLSAGPNGPARKLDFSGWVNETYLQTATVNIGEKVWENATIAGYSVRRQHYNTTDGLVLYDPVEMPLTWTAIDNATFAGEFNGTGKYGVLNGTVRGSAQDGTGYSESPFFKDRYIVGGLHTNSTDNKGNISLGVFFKNGTLDFVFIAPGQLNKVIYPGDDPSARFGALNLTWYFRKSDFRVLALTFSSDYNFTLVGLTLNPIDVFPTGHYLAFVQMQDYGQNSGFAAQEFDLDTVAPTAAAGPDVQIKDGDSTVFNGTLSSDDVGVANYTWTYSDGAANRTQYGPTPTAQFMTPGNYTVTLTARDAANNAGTDTLLVMVAMRDREAPVARAGNDISVGIGKNATLNGSASSDNIGIVDHDWMLSNGTANLTLSGAVASARFDILGTYVATLEVRDAEGNLGNDTVNVTVVDDIAPTARAGSDVSVPAGTEVTLNSSGSTDNIGIVSHTWLVNNGTGAKFLNGSVVKVRYDMPGTYLAGVRVRDAAGNNGTD